MVMGSEIPLFFVFKNITNKVVYNMISGRLPGLVSSFGGVILCSLLCALIVGCGGSGSGSGSSERRYERGVSDGDNRYGCVHGAAFAARRVHDFGDGNRL